MKRAKERLANMLKHKSLWLIGALSHLFLGSCEIVCHLRYETPPPIIIFLSFLLFVLSGNALLHIRLSQSKRNTAILLAIPLFSHFLSICILYAIISCSIKSDIGPDITEIETYQLSDFDGEITKQATWVIAPDEDNLLDGITVIVTNLTNERYPGPNHFWLEIEENDQWYIIPYKEPGFPEAFPQMAPNAENTFILGVNYHYGELKAGHYRIICEDRTKHSDNDYLILEFDVP